MGAALAAAFTFLRGAVWARVGAAATGIAAFTAGSLVHLGTQLSQILIVFLFFLLIRVFFTLAKAYLTILLLLILGPIIITTGAISGSGPIKSWFLNLLSNILVFPIIGFIMVLGQIIQALIVNNPVGTLWSPPYLGQDRAILSGAIGLGVLLMIPEVPNIIQTALKTQFPEIIPVQQLMQPFQQLRPAEGGAASALGHTTLGRVPIIGRFFS